MNGNVRIAAGLSAGSPNAIGTLTLGGTALTLEPTATVTAHVNAGASAGDLVTGVGTLNYGGATLNVLNKGGSFTAGQSFQLFSAAVYQNNFAVISPASPGAGLAWSNSLAIDGRLRVITGVSTTPTNITCTVSGGNLNLSWPADHLGWSLQVQTNSLDVGTHEKRSQDKASPQRKPNAFCF